MRIGSGSNVNRQTWAKSRNKIVSSAAEIFSGPRQTGTEWAAAFLQATDTTSAFKDYVQRNIDKFSGNTLKAMLISTDLVDWYQARQQKELADAAKSLADKIGALQEVKSTNRFMSRLRLYTPAAKTTGATTAPGDGTTPAPAASDAGANVDVTV